MIFSNENGFRADTGYDAKGLNRMNARFRVFMEPLSKEIAGHAVLDLASHDGRWSYAALKVGASHVTGIEGRAELIDKGKYLFSDQEFAGRFKFVVGDIFEVMPKLINQGKSFDVVLCLGIFYHIMDHYRLMRLIREFKPRVVILDTGLIDDEKPYISLVTERNDDRLNAIPENSDINFSIVGLMSKGGVRLLSKSLGYSCQFLDWNPSDFVNHDGLSDYFTEANDKRRRFSIVLRPELR